MSGHSKVRTFNNVKTFSKSRHFTNVQTFEIVQTFACQTFYNHFTSIHPIGCYFIVSLGEIALLGCDLSNPVGIFSFNNLIQGKLHFPNCSSSNSEFCRYEIDFQGKFASLRLATCLTLDFFLVM